MSDFEVTAADEGRHPPGPEELWGESWYLDWAAADASYGGYVRLGLYPNLGLSWWWIALVGEDRPLVLVVDHELPCGEGDAALTPSTGRHVGRDLVARPDGAVQGREHRDRRGAAGSSAARSTGCKGDTVAGQPRSRVGEPRSRVPVRDDDALRDLVVGHRQRDDR